MVMSCRLTHSVSIKDFEFLTFTVSYMRIPINCSFYDERLLMKLATSTTQRIVHHV